MRCWMCTSSIVPLAVALCGALDLCAYSFPVSCRALCGFTQVCAVAKANVCMLMDQYSLGNGWVMSNEAKPKEVQGNFLGPKMGNGKLHIMSVSHWRNNAETSWMHVPRQGGIVSMRCGFRGAADDNSACPANAVPGLGGLGRPVKSVPVACHLHMGMRRVALGGRCVPPGRRCAMHMRRGREMRRPGQLRVRWNYRPCMPLRSCRGECAGSAKCGTTARSVHRQGRFQQAPV